MARFPRKKTDVELIKDIFELCANSNGNLKIESGAVDYPLSTISLSFELEKCNENFKLIREYLKQ
jgi:hypothetical protein